MPPSNSRISVALWLQTTVCSHYRKHFDRGCARCGQPSSHPAATGDPGAVCRECNARDFAFDAARSYGIDAGNLATAIVLLNYEQIEPLGVWFAKRLSEVFAAQSPWPNCPRRFHS